MLDIIGEIFFFGMFATPIITIPIVWKLSSRNKWIKTIIGLVVAVVLSFIFYFISFAILMRNGLGPQD